MSNRNYDWPSCSHEGQLPPPGDWRVWLLMASRGFGKTRAGAEEVRARVKAGRQRIALIAPTMADARDIMVEGESGILAISPPEERPYYIPKWGRLIWPNGAQGFIYSAHEPDRLRDLQHDFAWCDELAAWPYREAWDALMFGLRLGDDPRAIVTTCDPVERTPGATMIQALLHDPEVAFTRGTVRDNPNLSPAFLKMMEGQGADVA